MASLGFIGTPLNLAPPKFNFLLRTLQLFWSEIFSPPPKKKKKLGGLLPCKATCIWKFVQRHFIASKLNAGCGGYLDKIYKILVDILDLKAGFLLTNFFIRSDFFRSKTIKSRIGSHFFLPRKMSQTNENSAKSRFVRKHLQVENRLNRTS